ncbi:MAG: hypothetical protein H6836_03575 [Planctomycetes bacterium]|nr:hypothetical protein [Planctomycetota bacterium]
MSAVDTAPRRRALPLLIAVLVVAGVLRGLAVRDGFWLDEAWSWVWLNKLQSFTDVFTKSELKHDNNHPLITVWMYSVGDRDAWVLYRIPSLFAGIATVVLFSERRAGASGVWLPAGAAAVSYPLIVYSTEARGYALAVVFALLGFRLLQRFEASGFRMRIAEVVTYGLVCCFGLASHLVFVHFLVAGGLWSAVAALRRLPFRVAVVRLAVLHGVPLGFAAWFYWTMVRVLRPGGASGPPLSVVMQDLCAWFTGAPNEAWAAFGGGLVLLGLAAQECWRRACQGSTVWVFVLAVAVVVPVLVLAANPVEGILYPRYFLVGTIFVLLFAASSLVRMLHVPGPLRWGAAVLVLAFVVGNVVRTVAFLSGGGRGQYRAAVEHIGRRSGASFTVGSDFDFRTRILLGYHKRFLQRGQQLAYLRDPQGRPRGDWFLVQSEWYPEDPRPRPRFQQRFAVPGGPAYELDGVYPFYGPSGCTWALYRRVR